MRATRLARSNTSQKRPQTAPRRDITSTRTKQVKSRTIKPNNISSLSLHERFFSTDNTDEKQNQNNNKNNQKDKNKKGDDKQDDENKNKKPAKQAKTWLQIYSDSTLRSLSGPLIDKTKASRNDDRVKVRLKQMSDFVIGVDNLTTLCKLTPDTPIWARQFQSKEPAVLTTYLGAVQMASEKELQIAGIRSCLTRPPVPDNMKDNVPDDGILPLWIMDTRAYLQDIYDRDTAQVKGVTTKDITLNTTITRGDLLRKITQAIDFLLAGNSVRFVAKSKSLTNLQTFVQRNSHLESSEIEQLTSELIEKGNIKDVSLNITKSTPFQRDVALDKIRLKNVKKAEENEKDYQARIQTLLQQEQDNHNARQNQHEQECKIRADQVSFAIHTTTTQMKQYEQDLRTCLTNFKTANSKLDKATQKTLVNGFFPPQTQTLELLKKKVEILQGELIDLNARLERLNKGFLVNATLKRPPSSVQYLRKTVDMDPMTKKNKTQEQDQDIIEDGDDDILSADDDGDSGSGRRRKDDDYDDDADVGYDDDDGGDNDGDDDDDTIPLDGKSDDSGAAAEKRSKLSKSALQKKREEAALAKMSEKDRINYIAGLQARQTYEVLPQIADAFASISTIVQQEREERKKKGIKFDAGILNEAQIAKLSNKERKMYISKMKAMEADPHATLRAELNDAMELYTKGNYIYNDAILLKNKKKGFWYIHDGGEYDDLIRKPSFLFKATIH